MLLWFLKLFVKSLKILFCALPLTTVVFFLLIITNIWILATGTSEILALVPKISGFELVSPSQNTVLSISEALKGWWSENIYSHYGSGAYIPLLFLTIIMFIPVVSVFLCISALSSFGKLLFCLISIDIAIYILRALGQKSFITHCSQRNKNCLLLVGRMTHNPKNVLKVKLSLFLMLSYLNVMIEKSLLRKVVLFSIILLIRQSRDIIGWRNISKTKISRLLVFMTIFVNSTGRILSQNFLMILNFILWFSKLWRKN